MRLVTAEQMRWLDARTIELGTPAIDLMERAGRGVADGIHRRFRPAARRGVLVVAGAGNNGGDGFVIARLLSSRGYRVQVALLSPESKVKGDALTNLERWRKRRGRLLALGDGARSAFRTELPSAIARAGLVVDAVFGTGLARDVEGAFAEAIEAIDRGAREGRRRPVVAVDLPSGLDADRGEPLGVAVRADATFTLGAVKLGLVLPAARDRVGELELVDIGLAEGAFSEIGPLAELSDDVAMRRLVPRREASGHKGTHGHLLVVAGAPGTGGAAVLAARAALRGGAGLVTVACPPEVRSVLGSSLPEAMTVEVGGPTASAWHDALAGKKALAIGPGLGRSRRTASLVRWLVTRVELPMVVDADGLNALASSPGLVRRARAPVVLTPHPGEMARLAGKSTAEVQGDRRCVALALARETGAVVVLKGSGTLVAAPDGRLSVNATGGPILGTGGTGDVLTGFVGSLLAQGVEPWDAARLGVFLHGRAGDRLAARLGSSGLLASELADELPRARHALVEPSPEPPSSGALFPRP